MTSLLDFYKILNTICFCSFLLGDKDKEIHNLSDCELENEVRDFDDQGRPRELGCPSPGLILIALLATYYLILKK